jgi:hypothetical protein
MSRRRAFRINLAALCLLLSAIAAAAPPALEPAKVMLLGMFHFANPGRDIVKARVIDVTTPENQAWLDGLADRMAAFRPTDVLAECSPSEQDAIDGKFRDYVAGRFALPANETYQIGFRVARRAGLARVTCFDEDKVGWNAQPMFEFIEKHDPALKHELDATFQSLSASMDQEQATLPLARLLQLTNDPARDLQNKALYLRTNGVDAGGGFVGADATASWWHRNFRMYANVQKAAAPGRRVIVLAGQGHTAILKDLLAADDRRVAEDARAYLEAGDRVAGGR